MSIEQELKEGKKIISVFGLGNVGGAIAAAELDGVGGLGGGGEGAHQGDRGDRGQAMARTYLTSETGKVYTMLAHAAGRFGE